MLQPPQAEPVAVEIRHTWTRSRSERSVELPEPIPIHIACWTAWVDDDGTLWFGQDIYDQDRELAGFLKSSPAAP